MNKILLTLMLGGLLSSFLADTGFASGNYLIDPPSASDVRLGKGCTTAYHVDEDCDGYGVGDGFSDLTIDPNDNDSTVYNLATAEAKYGSFRSGNYITNLKNFYCTTRGTGYCQIGNIWFVDPVNGDDNSGGINDINNPFKTPQYVFDNKMASGDMILLRGGTYTSGSGNVLYITYGVAQRHGVSAAKPNIVAGFPGERVILGQIAGNQINGMNNWYWTFDSLQIGRTDTDQTSGSGFYLYGIHFFTIRNCFLIRDYTAIWLMTGTDGTCKEPIPVTEDLNDDGVPETRNLVSCACPSNILIEKVVAAASGAGGGTHTFYWGCGGAYYGSQDTNRDSVSANITIRNSIFHSQTSTWDGFQLNGYFSNILFENNLFHSHGQDGVNWLNGVWSSIFRNNVVFNNGRSAFQMYSYSSNWNGAAKDNLIEGNTMWVGSTRNPNDKDQDPNLAGAIWIAQSTNPTTYPVKRNTFRNNILINYGELQAVIETAYQAHLQNNNFINNVIYATKSGATGAAQYSTIKYTLSAFEAAYPNSYGNIWADPLFIDVSNGYYSSVGKFNFDLTLNSPAINIGYTPSTLATDIKGRDRTGNPDAGAYEYPAQLPTLIRTTLQTGTASNKISLVFIPSGYTLAQAANFENDVANNLQKLWLNNFFGAYRQRFDVYRIDNQYDSDGLLKSDSEVETVIDADTACQGTGFGDSGTATCIHIVIDNQNGQSDTRINHVRLTSNADDYDTFAHEIGVHVLGKLSKYDSQFAGPITKDGYACSTYTYSYLYSNIHDKNSPEKWSDLTNTVASCGGIFYCPSVSSTDYSGGYRDFSNVAYKAAQIGMAKRTQDSNAYSALGSDFPGTIQYGQDKTAPSVTVSGIQSNTAYSQPVTIDVSASDASGIDRVEFYLNVDGAEYRSFAIDRTAPFTQQLDLSSYPGSIYSVRIYTFDEAWNYVKNQYDNLSKYSSPASCGDNDNDGYFNVSGCGTPVDCNDNNPNVNQSISCPYNGAQCGTFSLCQLTCPTPPAEICTNSLDDDCDGKADCSDSDCFGNPSCPKANCSSAVLIHHYDNQAQYGESTTRVYDFSNNGNNGTCSNCPLFTSSGKFSGAFQFNGTSNYISVPYRGTLELPDSGGGLTAWIYLDPSVTLDQNTYMGIFRKAIHSNWDAPGGYGIGLYQAGPSDPHVLRALVGNWSNVDDIRGTSGVSNSQWHHIALTWDTGTLNIYLDGSLEKSSARNKTLSYAIQTESFRVGYSVGGTSTGSLYFKGMIDELALWNRSLSSQDIQLMYTSGPVSCSQGISRADNNPQDGCISDSELFAFIDRWKTNNSDVTLRELIEAIGLWKRGGC